MTPRLSRLPLFTGLGSFLGVSIALGAVLFARSCGADAHPLFGFALAPLPAVAGMWLDWSRLYRPTRRTRFWSFAFLFLATFAGIEAALVTMEIGPRALALAPAVPLAGALLVFAGSRALLFLSRRGRSLGGYGVICGSVRRDESERVLVDAAEGLVELGRAQSEELGERRTVDLSIGAPIAVLANLRTQVAPADPFRTEGRSRVGNILAVASSPSRLREVLRARARAWIAYLLVLAVGATALAGAMSYEGEADPSAPCARGCVTKTIW